MEDMAICKSKSNEPEITGDYWYDKFCESQETIAILQGEKQQIKKALMEVIKLANSCSYSTCDRYEFNAHADLVKAINEAKEFLKL